MKKFELTAEFVTNVLADTSARLHFFDAGMRFSAYSAAASMAI